MATRREFIKSAAIAATAIAVSPLVETACAKTTDKKMKVLMINGSPHKNGNTATALEEVAAQLKTHGIDSEIFWIGVQPVHGCIACGRCNADGKCVFDDDPCNQIAQKMTESDALIVGSPVYYGQPNGAVLALVQRLFYSNGAAVMGKPAAAFAVCRRGGATASFQTLNMPFMMMNMPVVTSQYWNIGYGQSQGQISEDQEGMQTMRTLANNMAALLKATGGKPMPGSEERHQFTNFIR